MKRIMDFFDWRTRAAVVLTLVVVALGAAFAPSVHATSMGDTLEDALQGHVFKGAAFTAPTTLYVGLSTTACSDSSLGTEVTGGAYARVAVTSNGTNWSGPTAGDGTVANAVAVTFPAPSGGNWSVVTHWFIAGVSTGGTPYYCAALTQSKTINDGDAAPSFAIGALTVQIDN